MQSKLPLPPVVPPVFAILRPQIALLASVTEESAFRTLTTSPLLWFWLFHALFH
jgi:hypothetical protein